MKLDDDASSSGNIQPYRPLSHEISCSNPNHFSKAFLTEVTYMDGRHHTDAIANTT
jgi:hypothetical protein